MDFWPIIKILKCSSWYRIHGRSVFFYQNDEDANFSLFGSQNSLSVIVAVAMTLTVALVTLFHHIN